MCGRVVTSTPIAVLAEQYGAQQAFDEFSERVPAPSWNVAPTALLPAVIESRSRRTRRLGQLQWGLVPHWAKDPSTGNRTINARTETLTTKPTYRCAFVRHRCLIPVDAFYEWKRRSGQPKQPFVIAREDKRPLTFAGLWAIWRSRDKPDAEPLRTCTIVTTAANDLVRPLHDRMPVILPESAWDRWLDPNNTDVEQLHDLLRFPLSGGLVAYPVSDLVNRVTNDSPELVRPIADAVS